MLYPPLYRVLGHLKQKDDSPELGILEFPYYAEGTPVLRVLGSHRGGIEDDLRIITVVCWYHISRKSGKSRGGRWLGHHGHFLGLE